MAGHSKWANIKHRKYANDAKKSRLFGKRVREITLAAKQGGGEPKTNPWLRLAIQNARIANLPRANIERAIKSGSDKESSSYKETTYEGYAAHGVAVIVECITDNPSRTVAAIRAVFNRHGGSLSKNGSLTFLFDRKGVFRLSKETVPDEETLALDMIEAGATTFTYEADYLSVVCPLEAFGRVQNTLEVLKLPAEETALHYIPKSFTILTESKATAVTRLIEALKDSEDVMHVFHNLARTK